MKNLILLFVCLFCACFMPMGVTEAADVDYGEEKEVVPLEKPRREVSVIVTPEGYYPELVTVFKGEEVIFHVTGTQDAPDCLIVSNYPIFLGATRGRVTTGKVVFDKAGEYSMYCPGNGSKGKLVVMNKKKKGKRKIASVQQEWMPKD